MEQKRRIVPPVYLLLSLLAMGALHRWWPVARLLSPPVTYAGVLLMAAGLAITVTAARAFVRARTPLIPFERSTALVTGGLYRFTRNPMYLGMVMLLTGLAVLLGTATPWLPVPVFAWIIQAQFIVGEERFLEELFGEEYRALKRRVRRWI